MPESNDNTVFLRPVFNLAETGKRVGELMKERKIKPATIKVLMGFSGVQAIYNWTRGKNAPSLDNIIVLSKILGVPIDDIVVADTVEVLLDDRTA